jgi:hypothetical protein
MSIVTTDVEFILWREAQRNLEWSTTKFWEHKLQKVFPAADGWVVSSQQPPTSERGDRRRVETTVEVLQDSLQKLLVVEAKHHNAPQDEIQEVEAQAYNGCMKYLKYSGRTAMYAMTVVGTRARLWTVHQKEDYLEPYIPNDRGLAAIGEYIEANSTEGYQIMEGLEQTKIDHLLPPKKGQILKSIGSPQPSYTALPSSEITMTGTATVTASTSYTTPNTRSLPNDAQAVELEVELDGGVYYYSFEHNGKRYKVPYADWELTSTTYDGGDYPCYLYTGKKSGKHFWAWSLDLDKCRVYKSKGKGK